MNAMILVIFVILVLFNSIAQMHLKRRYADLEMQKNPKERRLSYLNSLLSDVAYAKEIRINGQHEFFISKLQGVLRELWLFYRRQMQLLKDVYKRQSYGFTIGAGMFSMPNADRYYAEYEDYARCEYAVQYPSSSLSREDEMELFSSIAGLCSLPWHAIDCVGHGHTLDRCV